MDRTISPDAVPRRRWWQAGRVPDVPGAPDPCDDITVEAADGAVLVVRAHGGHVTGWRGSDGGERLWLSTAARCGPGEAIRGGVPVVWPQFSDRGALPKHGFARDRAWQVVATGRDAAGAARAELVLTDDESTRALWPHPFSLRLVASATDGVLETTLTATNTGDAPWRATAALHAYLAVGDVGGARVEGLAGAVAEDNAAGRARREVPPGPMSVPGALDLAVRGVAGAVTVRSSGGRAFAVERENLPDVVVWNPGGSPPGDVHPGGAREFLCVEPAALDPVTVAPGEDWRAVARWRRLPA